MMACTPKLTLMSRSTGEVGTGIVENVTFGNSGTLSVTFSEETYSGQWIAVRNPGTYDFGLINVATFGGGGGYGNFNSRSTSDSGFGTALLRSTKGNSLRCEFNYSLTTVSAIGICKNNRTGEIFDLQAA
jgi:hypothetical protein